MKDFLGDFRRGLPEPRWFSALSFVVFTVCSGAVVWSGGLLAVIMVLFWAVLFGVSILLNGVTEGLCDVQRDLINAMRERDRCA